MHVLGSRHDADAAGIEAYPGYAVAYDYLFPCKSIVIVAVFKMGHRHLDFRFRVYISHVQYQRALIPFFDLLADVAGIGGGFIGLRSYEAVMKAVADGDLFPLESV